MKLSRSAKEILMRLATLVLVALSIAVFTLIAAGVFNGGVP